MQKSKEFIELCEKYDVDADNIPEIKSFEEACSAKGYDPSVLPDVSTLPEKHRAAIIAHYKLVIIAEALNEGWQPNWNDTDQWKYYPWFEVEASKNKPAGFGFSSTHYVGWYSGALVGSRLCYKSRDLALYAGKQFAKLYQEYFLIQ